MKINPERANALQQNYDIIIIGGGIHGAALAWEASKVGYSTLLIEKKDFASGTSSNSLKIIHGGIRYLQNMSLRRLFYSSAERSFLLQNFPHLVEPLQCFLPTEHKLSKNKLILSAAFLFYDLLTNNRNAGLEKIKKINNTGVISKKSFFAKFPNIKNYNYTGAVSWFDAQAINTERLVLSYAMSAKQNGSKIINYCSANSLNVQANTVTGVQATDLISGEEYEIQAKIVIDTTGPWSFYQNIEGNNLKRNTYIKAINVILDRNLVNHAIGLTMPSSQNKKSRSLFYTPWNNKTIAGTWYFTQSKKNADLDAVNQSQLSEILNDINTQFENINITKENITLIHSGMLPSTSSSNKIIEPHLIAESYILNETDLELKHLLVIQGTKLTTARVIALECLKQCQQIMKPKDTAKNEKQSCSNYGRNYNNYQDFLNQCMIDHNNIWSVDIIVRLAQNFGSNIQLIKNIAIENPDFANLVPGTDDMTKAEIEYVVDVEMVYTLCDLLFRRCVVGSIKKPSTETIDYCSNILMSKFQWSEEQKKQNIKELMELYPSWNTQQLQ